MRLPTGLTGKSPNAMAPQPTIPGNQGGQRTAARRETTNVAPAAERQSGGAGAVQQRSINQGAASSQIFASASAQQIARRTQGDGGRDLGSRERPNDHIFSAADKTKIASADKVYVAGFSSQGGGHTERMLMPLAAAIRAERAAEQAEGHAAGLAQVHQKNLSVVLVLPPHWENDTGNEFKKLAHYKEEYLRENVHLVTVQSDKAILGFYEPDGPSDNFGILKEFADKPKRDNSETPLFAPRNANHVIRGQAFAHKEIMSQIADIVGNKDKITVFEDMDPYLAKAAAKSGVPSSHIVGQSNHLLLLDADIETNDGPYFTGKSDAFLVKANGNGYIGNAATVEFSADINTTKPLGQSLDKMGIDRHDNALKVRKHMMQMLLDGGKKIDLQSRDVVPMSGGVMVSPGATSESLDRGVYLYLNKYTDPLAQHIRDRLNGNGTDEQTAAYKRAMFVVCGAGTFDPATEISGNAMHVAQAANFDAVTAAGFGTSSEMHYLISNDAYHGNLLLMPVERQHEQEANAEILLPAALGDRRDKVDAAENIEDLRNKLDEMVVHNATTNDKLSDKTMEALHTATHRESPLATDKAVVRLTTKTGMTADEARLLDENTRRASDPDRKALRRINKVMIPALMALSEGKVAMDIRMTAKDAPKSMTIRGLIEALRDPDQAGALMDADFSGEVARSECQKCVNWLEDLLALDHGPTRQQAAQSLMRGTYANDTHILGY
jgi:hypothetical protein